ncbi:hypothetical protein XPA_004944 [Xanthoria parietina]
MSTRVPQDTKISARQENVLDSGAYDQVLIEITTYVFHYKIDNLLAKKRARFALLDALGCAIETLHTSSECTNIIGPVVPGTIVPHGFRLPGTGYELDPLKGAFDLGTMIRYLDHNDAFGGAEWGHPSDNIGALLSVADWLARSSAAAREQPATSSDSEFSQQRGPLNMDCLLTALIKAYEIQGGLQQLNSFNAVGLDHTILVKVASTAVVSWLMGLSEAQAMAAVSHAFQDGHPLRTFRQSPNTGPRKGWAAGDACMRAVQMALLASKGQPGAPTVLTDPKWGFYRRLFQGKKFELQRPYSDRVIQEVGFKLVPAEGHGISAVEAALQIVQTLKAKGLNAEKDVARLLIRTQAPAYTIINKTGPLKNAADRDHCLQYMIAVVLLKGAIIETVDYMEDSPWAVDPRVDCLRAKMEVVNDKTFTRDYYDGNKRSCSNAIQVFLENGHAMDDVVVEYPIGHPDRAETLEHLQKKTRRNLELGFDDERVDKIFKAVGKDDLPVQAFVDLFVQTKN